MTTNLPGSNVVNPVHLPGESPRTCIFWQAQLTASPLAVQLDQTSLSPPHSHNQCMQHETKHDEENEKSYLDKSDSKIRLNGTDMLSFQQST